MTTANDNQADPTPFDELEHARLGDVFVHKNGSKWEVIAACMHPTLMLKRTDRELPEPLERDCLYVVPGSPWSKEWKIDWAD